MMAFFWARLQQGCTVAVEGGAYHAGAMFFVHLFGGVETVGQASSETGGFRLLLLCLAHAWWIMFMASCGTCSLWYEDIAC